MSEKFICPLCGNSDEKYVGYLNGKPYCRLCITFKGKEADYTPSRMGKTEAFLNYSLSEDQQRLSDQLLENYKNGYNSFVSAVCGSGKTEIVIQVIKYVISVGYKCGFAVPRKDVASELHERFKNIFKNRTVTLVCGGHSENLYGDLVILTTHQLYRYSHYFDLLVLDEVDAFPFKGSLILYKFFENSLKSNFIMMSATPDSTFLANFGNRGGKILELNSRFHKYPLPVPQIIVRPTLLCGFELIKHVNKMLKVGKQVFIFTPTISMCEETATFLGFFFMNKGTFVHSKREDRPKVISDFRKKKYSYLVTTAVLERGVTVKDLQVIVYHAEHKIYDQYSLVQIAGRVGRKADCPTGEVIYIASRVTSEMEKSISNIEKANKDLQSML